MAITRAPMERAHLTAAEPNAPVAGAMMIVSPGWRLISFNPPYGTRSLREVSFKCLRKNVGGLLTLTHLVNPLQFGSQALRPKALHLKDNSSLTGLCNIPHN